MSNWEYRGDRNIECGGMFVLDEGDVDFVRIVDVIPVSDAGGPNNKFLIEIGSLYMPDDEKRRKQALDTVGWFEEDGDEAHKRACLIDGFKAYHGIDKDAIGGEIVVQIGKDDKDFWDGKGWNPKTDRYLSAKTDLKAFIEAEYLK